MCQVISSRLPARLHRPPLRYPVSGPAPGTAIARAALRARPPIPPAGPPSPGPAHVSVSGPARDPASAYPGASGGRPGRPVEDPPRDVDPDRPGVRSWIDARNELQRNTERLATRQAFGDAGRQEDRERPAFRIGHEFRIVPDHEPNHRATRVSSTIERRVRHCHPSPASMPRQGKNHGEHS